MEARSERASSIVNRFEREAKALGRSSGWPISGGEATCQPTTNFGVADDEIVALAMNLTIIDRANAPGFAVAKPTQNAPFTSMTNWYEVGATVQSANQGIVTMDLTAADAEFVALDFDLVATCPAGYAITEGGFNHSTGTLGGVLETQSSRDGSNQGCRCRGMSFGIIGIGSTGFCQAVCARTVGR